MQIHASCAARDGAAVLLVGPAGCGKSDLLLRLLEMGFSLVADDRVIIERGVAAAPPSLAGLIEIHGLGITRLKYVQRVPLRLIVRLVPDAGTPRLPYPTQDTMLNLPIVAIDPFQISAAFRVAVALDCAIGKLPQVAGAFAP